jgi:hypothetical protein
VGGGGLGCVVSGSGRAGGGGGISWEVEGRGERSEGSSTDNEGGSGVRKARGWAERNPRGSPSSVHWRDTVRLK